MLIQDPGRRREGAVLPLVTVCLVGLLAFVALAIDIGMMALARTQAQSAADIGALSGARTLNGSSGNNKTNAEAQAQAAIVQNYILGTKLTSANVFTVNSGVYRYNTTANRFLADFDTPPDSTEAYGAIRVEVRTEQPTFFGKLLGINAMALNAKSTAVHRPRDIAVVLDFSGSMMFSSETSYPRIGTATGTISGSLNPDSRFPRFGPWSMYPVATSGSPNPMQRLEAYVDGGGETHAANNQTMETDHGPTMINNFQTTASNGGPNAFVYNNDLTGGSFNLANTPVCTPTPSSWSSQYSSGYAGDRWPLKQGVSGTSPTVAQYAKHVADIVFPTGTTITNSTRDANWETNGYDSPTLTFTNGSFKGYAMGPGYYGKSFYVWPPDPRYDSGADPTSISSTNPAQDSSGRWMCDWRKRFFLQPSADAAVKGAVIDDNAALYSATNGRFNAQNLGGTLNYIPNYDAILQWIKTGPQTLPPAVRAGRVLYYSAIPDSIPMNWSTGLIDSTATLDQRFWKDYIDFVIGCGQHNRRQTLYGVGTNNTYSGSTFGTPKITAKSGLTGTTPPYMHYQDVPVHPRLHLWFGPQTMLSFFNVNNFTIDYNWNAGTTYEAHCWQLKAGINAALADIRNNHPNDLASLMYFSTDTTPRVAMGKDYTRMQRSLFYPRSLLNSLGNLSAEKRPYKSSNTIDSTYPSGLDDGNYWGDIPLSAGGTNPALGMMIAYNQCNWTGGYTGRRGATKIIILETDGVANAAAAGTLSTISGGGGAKQWTSISGGTNTGNGDPASMNAAITLAWLINQDTSGSKPWPTFPAYTNMSGLPTAGAPVNYYGQTGPGMSTPRSPSQVHALAFGQLFESTTTSKMKTRSLEFLRNIQIAGGTSPAGASSIESYKIIVGTYSQRINLLRQGLRGIVQGGIQVSLIQ